MFVFVLCEVDGREVDGREVDAWGGERMRSYRCGRSKISERKGCIQVLRGNETCVRKFRYVCVG